VRLGTTALFAAVVSSLLVSRRAHLSVRLYVLRRKRKST
jgi:hypothetical protein